MKKYLFFVILACLLGIAANAQNRSIARGAEPGELYLTGPWYGIFNPVWGPPFYDTLRYAVYRITENGKKLTIQYDADAFADYYTPIGSVMQPSVILADATSGVVYNKCTYSKNSYEHTSLWVSFDYGKTWIFREESIGSVGYIAAGLNEGVICKGGENRSVLKSDDYGVSFDYFFTIPLPYSAGEIGYQECEFYGRHTSSYTNHFIDFTNDCSNSFTTFPIDSQYIYNGAIFPSVYRGGLPGEVYINSMFSDFSYKVSFSADTGRTFRHVYICERDCFDPFGYFFAFATLFMSDREPGVFYIVQVSEVEDSNPLGYHINVCIEYYRDYGETLVDIYCHDLTKEGVVTAIEEIDLYSDEVLVYPNPTDGTLTIDCRDAINRVSTTTTITNIEIFDVFGRMRHVETQCIASLQQPTININISHFPTGTYFIRITKETDVITRKIVKQ